MDIRIDGAILDITKFNLRNLRTKNDREFIIRVATKPDAAGLLALGKEVMGEREFTLTEADELDLTVEQEENWIQEHLDNRCKIILVAEIENEVVGIIDFANGHRRRIAHTGELGMSVVKQLRGQGIGEALLSSLLTWAKENPTIEKVNLLVHATNERAISLYRKLGFQEEGRRKKDLKLGPNEYVDSVLMGIWVK